MPAVPLPGDGEELGQSKNYLSERVVNLRGGPDPVCHRVHWLLVLGLGPQSGACRKDLSAWSSDLCQALRVHAEVRAALAPDVDILNAHDQYGT